MRTMRFGQAIDDALASAMADDPAIVVMGEDVPLIRRNLLVRFGPRRVLGTPISESAFLGAAVSAAMAGLHPVVELYMADFVGVCLDALLNHAAKLEAFSGGAWSAPMVVRVPCGGGYGDGGQHEQALWGLLGHIPGLSVVVPSNAADAGGLMLAALAHDGPVVYMEHKLLSESLLDGLGTGGRRNLALDVPASGARGAVPDRWSPLPLGRASCVRQGTDITIASLGVGVHRALEAAARLSEEGVSASVLDLRCVSPLDAEALCASVARTGRLLAVDEDYVACGLSGELAATVLEAGIPCRYARVCCETTIPYARALEAQALPNVERIVAAARVLLGERV